MPSVYAAREDGSTEEMSRVRCKDDDCELQRILGGNADLLPGDQIDPDDPRRRIRSPSGLPSRRHRSSPGAVWDAPERCFRPSAFNFWSQLWCFAEIGRSPPWAAPGSPYKASGMARFGFTGSTSTEIRVPSLNAGVLDERRKTELTLYGMPSSSNSNSSFCLAPMWDDRSLRAADQAGSISSTRAELRCGSAIGIPARSCAALNVPNACPVSASRSANARFPRTPRSATTRTSSPASCR